MGSDIIPLSFVDFTDLVEAMRANSMGDVKDFRLSARDFRFDD